MEHIDLFSGMGGFSEACDRLDIETIVFCEMDEFCTSYLNERWSGIPVVKDVKSVKKIKKIVTAYTQSERGERWGDGSWDSTRIGTRLSGCDDSLLLTAGFPCQPFSNAGRKRGSADNRYLWPQTLAVIESVRPDWIILENVAGLLGMVFPDSGVEVDRQNSLFPTDTLGEAGLGSGKRRRRYDTIIGTIMDNIRNAGYEATLLVLPACAVGAPHRRDRVWIVAHAIGSGAGSDNREIGDEGWRTSQDRGEGIRQGHGAIGSSGTDSAVGDDTNTISDTEGSSHRERVGERERGRENTNRSGRNEVGSNLADKDTSGRIITDPEHDGIIRTEEQGINHSLQPKEQTGQVLCDNESARTNSLRKNEPTPNSNRAGSGTPGSGTEREEQESISQREQPQLEHSRQDINAPDTSGNGSKTGLSGQNKREEGKPGIINDSPEERNWWQENWYEVATRLCRVDDGLPDWFTQTDRRVISQAIKAFGREEVERQTGLDCSEVNPWRTEQLKALGNAIVPEVAYWIIKTIVKVDKYFESPSGVEEKR